MYKIEVSWGESAVSYVNTLIDRYSLVELEKMVNHWVYNMSRDNEEEEPPSCVNVYVNMGGGTWKEIKTRYTCGVERGKFGTAYEFYVMLDSPMYEALHPRTEEEEGYIVHEEGNK